MKRSFFMIACVALASLLAFAPKSADPVDNLLAALQRWTDVNPQEKVYLHMDKPYYAIGDTVWFKAYVTIGSRHELSKMSGALYVELIDEKDSLLSSLKLPVVTGMAIGDFALADEYRGGNFRIRAYTQWMRNAGEEYFFDKSFAVGDPLSLSGSSGSASGRNTKKPEKQAEQKPVALSVADIQFFPEGGSMVNGMNARVGFKAVSPGGLGVPVKGIILDNSGIEVSSLESLHAGMGVFNLRPESGKNYKAKLSFTDGSQKTVDLPKAAEEGYILAVYQPSADSVLVRINAAQSQYQLSPAVNLVVHSGGELIYSSQIRISKAINSVWLLKKDFPTGIAQFTLFDYTGQPVNERIAFIKSGDGMKLEVKTGKPAYKSRERVDLDLLARDKMGRAAAGNFSVSVIDESKVPSDENTETTILSGLLLSSDIKGYIEQPSYYFSSETIEVNKALDNLMLTQGYRRFSWKDLSGASSEMNQPKYRAESLGTEISGRVLTLAGKPVPNGMVTVMSLNPGFMEQARTDANGRFAYAPIMLADSLRFAVQAVNQKKSKKVEVVLDSIPVQVIGKNWNIPGFNTNIAANQAVYLQNSVRQDSLLSRMGGLNRVNRLREVQIKARKLINAEMTTQGSMLIPDGHADFTYVMKDANCLSLGMCLQGRLGKVNFRAYPQNNPQVMYMPHVGNTPMQVFLDGTRQATLVELSQLFDQNGIDPKDIIKVEAVTDNAALMQLFSTKASGTIGGPAGLFIYTRKKRTPYRYTPNVVNIKPKGFNKVREFYAPRYDRASLNSQLPDLRSTIYWNPKVKTLESGRTRLSFFNADGPGTYKVVVEGINAAGELARAVYRYEVGAGDDEPLAELPSMNTMAVVNPIQDLQERRPAEQVYLHTDKPYYNMGDTLWFKAYLLNKATLAASKTSALLYVELADDTAEAVRRITIPIKNGVGYAQIPLTGKIFHEGGYTLRAYTNWMQNFGEAYFFTSRFYLGVPSTNTWLVSSGTKLSKEGTKDQLQTAFKLSRTDRSAVGMKMIEAKIMEGDKQLHKEKLQTAADGTFSLNYDLGQKADGKNIRVEILSLDETEIQQRLMVPLNISRNQMIDLQFLPEGGKLVAGLKSVVGLKALSENGSGVQVAGEIYDSKGQVAAGFSSLYRGMGSFEFTPLAGEMYTARITQPAGISRTFAFPVAQTSGTVMRVSNPIEGDSLLVDIVATADVAGKDSVWYLIGTSRGNVAYARNIALGQHNHLAIAKKPFPRGIMRFTLVKDKLPVNERLVFVDERKDLIISMSSNKTAYLKKDSVDLEIEVRDEEGNPVKGNFSLSVTDDNQVQADTMGNSGILASLLLKSELKGTVERPGYYLDSKNKTALDNLLLTQGWKGYDWKDVFAPVKEPEFAAEKHFKVTGLVKSIANRPVVSAPVLISSQKPYFIRETMTDEKGRYTFEDLPRIDSGSFFIQARTKKGRPMNFGEVTVDKFKAPKIPLSYRDQVMPWYVNTEEAQLNYVRNAVVRAKQKDPKLSGISLLEVEIKNRKKIKGSWNPAPAILTDITLDEQEIKESAVMNLYQLLKQKIPGFKIDKEDGYAVMKVNRLIVNLVIDGLRYQDVLFISDLYSEEELKAELSGFQIATFRGLEAIINPAGRHFVSKHPSGGSTFSPGGSMREMNNNAAAAAAGAIPVYVSRGLKEYVNIYLTTKNETGWLRVNKSDMITYRPLPVMLPSEFYSPRYRSDHPASADADLRSTVFWKPDVITDVNGKARLSFYTTDLTGTYSVDLQGADLEGRIGSARTTIKVLKPVTP